MKIQNGQCPHHQSFKPAIVDKLKDERADEIPCPMLRTLINEDVLPVAADGTVRIKDLNKALKKVGVKFLPRLGLVFGAKQAAAAGGGIFATLAAREFNIFSLYGSSLDHTGDTQILRGGFNQEKLDNLLRYSSDGENISLKDLARAQEDLVAAEPGKKGQAVGAAELTALLLVFGRENAEGDKSLRNDEVVTIFKDNRFPKGWKRNPVGAFKLGMGIKKFFDYQKDGPDGPSKTNGAKAQCPFLQGKDFSVDEASVQHADVERPDR